MKILDTIKKKIALRRERKTIMSKMSYRNGRTVIDADVIATVSDGACGCEKFGNAYVKFDDTHYSFKVLTDISNTNIRESQISIVNRFKKLAPFDSRIFTKNELI